MFGGEIVTVACPLPATALGAPGVPGATTAAVGITELLVALAAEVPALLVAVAVKV